MNLGDALRLVEKVLATGADLHPVRSNVEQMCVVGGHVADVAIPLLLPDQ